MTDGRKGPRVARARAGLLAMAAAAGLIALAPVVVALAEGQDMSEVIEGRKQNFKDMGGAMKNIMDEERKPTPIKILVTQYASQLNDVAHDFQRAPDRWFPAGSGPETGLKTRAKPEIWTNKDEFKKDIDAMVAEVDKLSTVVDGGDSNAIKAQLKATGKACGDCHKTFRVKGEDD